MNLVCAVELQESMLFSENSWQAKICLPATKMKKKQKQKL